MDKNLKFTDDETELFYDMIAERCSIHFQDNSQISFKHLYQLWESMYRSEYFEEIQSGDIMPFRFVIVEE